MAGGDSNTMGFFDQATVDAAYSAAGNVTILAAIVLVVSCYLLTRTTLGPQFLTRWWVFMAGSVVAGFLVPFGILHVWDTRAAPDTCEANPLPFAQHLPWSEILTRSMIGLLWGALAFFALSLALTRTVGRFSWSRGIFHNRGCPWPRIVRIGE